VSVPTLVVDTSAVVAIATGEPDADSLRTMLGAADERVMSAGSLQELLTVLGLQALRHGQDPRPMVLWSRLLVEQLGITVVPVDDDLAVLGAVGVVEHRGRPARLNFGDGFAYALAARLRVPLLCKGDDFVHTDIETITPATD
jgi:ribonuclease VapC